MLQGMVIRGTTPKHEFDLPYPLETVKDLRITYGQGKKIIFVKDINDCTVTEGKITLYLTQEETLSFIPNKRLYIEVRIQLIDNQIVQAEEPIALRVVDTMNEEVIS
jgi:hypothetical protein